jgi:hypothetical protein
MFFEIISVITLILSYKNNYLKEKELNLIKKKLYELNKKN